MCFYRLSLCKGWDDSKDFKCKNKGTEHAQLTIQNIQYQLIPISDIGWWLMWYQYCANYLEKMNNLRYVTNAVCHSLSSEHAGFRFTIAVQDCGSWTVAYKSAFFVESGRLCWPTRELCRALTKALWKQGYPTIVYNPSWTAAGRGLQKETAMIVHRKQTHTLKLTSSRLRSYLSVTAAARTSCLVMEEA